MSPCVYVYVCACTVKHKLPCKHYDGVDPLKPAVSDRETEAKLNTLNTKSGVFSGLLPDAATSPTTSSTMNLALKDVCEAHVLAVLAAHDPPPPPVLAAHDPRQYRSGQGGNPQMTHRNSVVHAKREAAQNRPVSKQEIAEWRDEADRAFKKMKVEQPDMHTAWTDVYKADVAERRRTAVHSSTPVQPVQDKFKFKQRFDCLGSRSHPVLVGTCTPPIAIYV